jgi:sec-independent protein translocase protein TatA
MGSMSLWHWLIVGLVILILFGGRGRISEMMGDLAKGIKSFRKGLAEEDNKPLDQKSAQPNETKTN